LNTASVTGWLPRLLYFNYQDDGGGEDEDQKESVAGGVDGAREGRGAHMRTLCFP